MVDEKDPRGSLSSGGTDDSRPVVAVYRWSLLPPSETFIRSQAMDLRRFRAIFVGGVQQEEGLPLPRDRLVVGTPGGRWQRAVRRRLPRYDPEARIVRACRERGVRLIHAHFGPDGLRAARLAHRLDVPLVVTIHAFDAAMSDEALTAAGQGAYVHGRPELFASATLIITVSEFIAAELRRRGASANKLRVHHVGVAPASPPERVPREPTVLFVGRDVAKKGLADLISAMAQVRTELPTARLLVVGDGPLRAEHEAQAHAAGVEADFVGWLSAEEVGARMQGARALCVPSRRAPDGDAEGLPTVIPEAMARGLPVVATRHSGIPEAVAEGRGGLLADEGDVGGIARHLAVVLSDDTAWQALSAAARHNARRNFDPEHQTVLLEAIYDEALTLHRRSP